MSDEEKDLMIECDNLVKIYKTAETEVIALQGLDLEVKRGEMMAIIGNSGSGKSTLLNMLGGLDQPSAGHLIVDGQDLLKLNKHQLEEYKSNTVGFVWQNNARNLIPYLTAVENVEIPLILTNEADRRHRAEELLDMVGLGHRMKNKLNQLSGGEQQRVAIAIALANTPKLLLADEPTGAVDSRTAKDILDLFNNINRNLGITVVIVTHDIAVSRKVDRVVSIRDGRTSSEFIRRSYSEDLKRLDQKALEEGEISADDIRKGTTDDTHDEFMVLDRAGRLQLPKDYMDAHGLKGSSKLRLTMDGDKIILEPEEKAAE